jgi:hypothetical protein
LYVAVIVSSWRVGTEVVTMAMGSETVEPAATLTEAGTVAYEGWLTESVIVAPPAGATSVRVTVFPSISIPPVTVVVDSWTALTKGCAPRGATASRRRLPPDTIILRNCLNKRAT